jgi:excisionase family DNA binding protein
MKISDLAERWGVGERTIRKMIASGEIKVLRIGRLVKISRSHVEWLEEKGTVRDAG